ncbi:MAG TPA: Uma2 family endonuclease [Candidatus Binatia bacterium]|jgi:Uma2 family endonuclease|nr:Uma2 family endonuclease [Candidatus Binatia bacterium]
MPVTLTKKTTWTDEALEALPRDGYKYELLDRELIMSPVHANHGAVCMRLGALLFNFVQRRKLGEVYDSSTGFRLSGQTLLSPDLSFVSKTRLKKVLVAPDKFLSGAPDLVVEVLSPSDRLREIHRKLDLYFEHGTSVVWLVNWKIEQVHIYRPDRIEALTRPQDVLSGEELLPGFRCRLSRIFHGW